MIDSSQTDLWFGNNFVEVAVSQRDNPDGDSVLKMTLPFDEAPPLQIDHDGDEIFHVLDGEVRFEIAGRSVVSRARDTLLARRHVPHGFRVVSRTGARMLIVTGGGLEAVVRATSRPAAIATLPEPIRPTADMEAALTHQCALHGIQVVGPPIC